MDNSWQQMTDEEQRRHKDELKEYDNWMAKEPTWWKFLEEWAKEQLDDWNN
jgi:hypothetical protein